MQNLKLDPEKRDYVFENGSPVGTDSILEKTYYALLIPRGRWIYGEANQGSYIHLLYNAKKSPSIEQQFASYAAQAIKDQLVQKGEATSASIKNLQSTRTGTLNQVTVSERASQAVDQFEFVGV